HARASDLAHVDRRHVEIARALATSPSVLLLDEPAAGLGREDKQRRARLLRRIADAGIGVLFVEHDMSVVMEISDHVVVLDAGTPIARGAPAAGQEDPAVRTAYLGEDHGRPVAHRAASAELGERLLEVKSLRAGYGAEPVLKGVDLNVRTRELVAVLCANGAGTAAMMRAPCWSRAAVASRR